MQLPGPLSRAGGEMWPGLPAGSRGQGHLLSVSRLSNDLSSYIIFLSFSN